MAWHGPEPCVDTGEFDNVSAPGIYASVSNAAGKGGDSAASYGLEDAGPTVVPIAPKWKQQVSNPYVPESAIVQEESTFMASADSAASRTSKRKGQTCWFFEQGMCTKGISCSYSHEGGVEAWQANKLAHARIDALTPTCWFYERGVCTKGSSCTFKHSGVVLQGTAVLNKKSRIESILHEDDAIWTAVKVALEPVGGAESEAEMQRLRIRIAQYARSSVQGIDLHQKPVSIPIDKYADSLFSKLFNILGDRHWLLQADTLLILDASLKELLPAEMLAEVPPEEFDSLVFSAHDRAVDEQRILPLLWDAITAVVQGPKTRTKTYKALEVGRRDTMNDPEVIADGGAEVFARHWIAHSLEHLRRNTGGFVDSILPEYSASELFTNLVEGGGLPVRCMAEVNIPDEGWPAVVKIVLDSEYRVPVGRAAPPQPSTGLRPAARW